MGKVQIIDSSSAENGMSLCDVWETIRDLYAEDPTHAVRSQKLIKTLHQALAIDLYSYLSKAALKRGVRIVEEAPLFGSYKQKDVDIAVVDPFNGPLITVGVRSQMSSIGNNVLTYYQDIIGECISLQERFPMTTMGYVYMHPLSFRKGGKKVFTDVERYAKLYASIAQRDNKLYKHQLGSFDSFAYAVVDFDDASPRLRDDVVKKAVADIDMSLMTFTQRMVETFVARNVWLDWLFIDV